MSEPDAVPLPRAGEVFFDVRGDARSMRLSWYADSRIAVFSIWQAGRCTGTFRLPFAELARMIQTLQSGPRPRSAPAQLTRGSAGYPEDAYGRPERAGRPGHGRHPESAEQLSRGPAGAGAPDQAAPQAPGYRQPAGYSDASGYTDHRRAQGQRQHDRAGYPEGSAHRGSPGPAAGAYGPGYLPDYDPVNYSDAPPYGDPQLRDADRTGAFSPAPGGFASGAGYAGHSGPIGADYGEGALFDPEQASADYRQAHSGQWPADDRNPTDPYQQSRHPSDWRPGSSELGDRDPADHNRDQRAQDPWRTGQWTAAQNTRALPNGPGWPHEDADQSLSGRPG